MKKYLLFILGLACYTPTIAQQQWRIAPTVGLNTASVSLSRAYKADLNSGTLKTDFGIAFRWQIGAFADYTVNDRFSFRSGLFYTNKGSSMKFSDSQVGTITINGNLESHYLEVPVLVTVAVGQKGYRLVGGPTFGVALGGKSTLDPVRYLGNTVYSGTTINFSVGSDANDGLLPTESSLIIGLIREKERFGIPLEIGVYSQIGLSNWDPGIVYQPGHTIRNGLFGLKIAYFFDVGR